MSTETMRLIRDGEKGEGGMLNYPLFILYTFLNFFFTCYADGEFCDKFPFTGQCNVILILPR